MRVVQSCTICKNLPSCGCQPSLVRLFELLDKVSKRVLSKETTSGYSTTPPLYGAGIDKLNGHFTSPISLQAAIEHIIKKNIPHRKTFLGKKPFLEIGADGKFIHLKIHYSQTHIEGIESNPNRFGTWPNYLNFLSEAGIPQENINVSRMDYNLDYLSPYQELLKQLDIPKKQLTLKHEEKNGKKTGAYFGKGEHTIVVYDKTSPINLAASVTRVDFRCQGSALPTRILSQIPDLSTGHNPFDSLTGLSVALFAFKNESLAIKGKYEEFISRFETDGFYSARKLLNKNGNFIRDFKDLGTIKKWHEQPSVSYNRMIQTFFNQTNHEGGNQHG